MISPEERRTFTRRFFDELSLSSLFGSPSWNIFKELFNSNYFSFFLGSRFVPLYLLPFGVDSFIVIVEVMETGMLFGNGRFSVIITTLWGFLEYMGWQPHNFLGPCNSITSIKSSFGNPNVYAGYLGLMTPFFFTLLLFSGKRSLSSFKKTFSTL